MIRATTSRASISAGAAQQQRELVAADAERLVAFAHELDEQRGDPLEHPVAGGVAVSVVDRS